MSRAAALQARWKALAPREQSLVLAAAGVVLLALLWWVALAPALGTLRQAPELHGKLDLQLQHMQRLQAEAQQLQAQPQTSPTDAVGALRAALTQRLGTAAQMNVLGDRVTVTLKGAPADAVAQWQAKPPFAVAVNTGFVPRGRYAAHALACWDELAAPAA